MSWVWHLAFLVCAAQLVTAFTASSFQETQKGAIPSYPKLKYEEAGRLIANKVVARRCDIDRRDASTLSVKEFRERYAGTRPVVIVDVEPTSEVVQGALGGGFNAVERQSYQNEVTSDGRNTGFRKKTSVEALLSDHGDMDVVLSSANSYSHEKLDSTFAEYLLNYVKPQPMNSTGGDSWYLFGDHNTREWRRFFEGTPGRDDGFTVPSYAGPENSLSFGIGGYLTGVPFHLHGGGFSEVLHGGKLWLLYPPHAKIPFVTSGGPWNNVLNEDYSILQWILEAYGPLQHHNSSYLPLECVILPGEALYFPKNWLHAIVNTADANVFMTTFTNGEDGGPNATSFTNPK